MNDIEKVEKVIKQLKLLSTHNVAPNIMNEAIQTIRKLQEDCNRYHEWGMHEGYEEGYAKGGSDMEKAKQIIIDKLQEQIPKWHLCEEELPTGEQYRTHNGQFIVANCQKVYAEWFDIYETKLFGEPTMSRFRTDRSVIAWMELPKFESEE